MLKKKIVTFYAKMLTTDLHRYHFKLSDRVWIRYPFFVLTVYFYLLFLRIKKLLKLFSDHENNGLSSTTRAPL